MFFLNRHDYLKSKGVVPTQEADQPTEVLCVNHCNTGSTDSSAVVKRRREKQWIQVDRLASKITNLDGKGYNGESLRADKANKFFIDNMETDGISIQSSIG